ncbi:MAG: DUF1214 domain-containing protein [Sphingomonadales bacterium]|nr:DUF1214 domain-containing protein [Sphingomonadales bacterium]
MKKRLLALLGLAAGGFALAQSNASAQTAAPAANSAPEVPGWAEYAEAIRTLPARMLARLPASMQADPQIRQEVARLALESIASQSLDAVGGDGDAPRFLPAIGQVFNVGQPNADTTYRSTWITPGGTYRITGKRGSLRLSVIAQVVPGKNGRSHLDLATLPVDKDGRYSVLVGPEKPAGYDGAFWALEPGVVRLMLRMVSADWGKEAEPTLAIERVDKPVNAPRTPAATLEGRLRRLPKMVDMMGLMFVDHVEKLRADGFTNKLKVFDVPEGALAGQFYYEGAYDLADDEALVIDSPVPAKCEYRSLILTNEIYETIDWINNHSSLNDTQAAPDSDGRLRIVISAKDPGVKNWMDTSGYSKGAVQGRWTGCDSHPIPEVKVVKLKDLKKVLPKDVAMVTPAQREEILRARRRAQLERPLW